MDNEELMNKFIDAAVDMDSDLAIEAANEAIATGVNPLDCIEHGLSAGMQTVSDLFDEGEGAPLLPPAFIFGTGNETCKLQGGRYHV